MVADLGGKAWQPCLCWVFTGRQVFQSIYLMQGWAYQTAGEATPLEHPQDLQAERQLCVVIRLWNTLSNLYAQRKKVKRSFDAVGRSRVRLFIAFVTLQFEEIYSKLQLLFLFFLPHKKKWHTVLVPVNKHVWVRITRKTILKRKRILPPNPENSVSLSEKYLPEYMETSSSSHSGSFMSYHNSAGPAVSLTSTDDEINNH